MGSYYIGFVGFQQARFFPNVDVYAEKGSGVDTVVGIALPNLNVGQLITDPAQFLFAPGDGNQEETTNSAIMAWNKMKCFHFELNDNPRVEHLSLPGNPDVLARLLVNLERPKSVCRGGGQD